MGIQIVKQADYRVAIKTKIEGLEKEFSNAVDNEIQQMVKRTLSGTDKDNKQFVKYSDSYAKYKKKKGRNISPVDLTFSGKMLRAITFKTFKQGTNYIAEVFFNGSKEEQKAKGNLKYRQFFAFSKDQIAKIHQRIKTSFK